MNKKHQEIRGSIIKNLYFNNIISCAELSNNIYKSIPVTTKFLNDLIEEGLVKETGLAQSTGGRRPAMYTLETEVLFVVSVAMDQFVTRIVIMDMNNEFATGEEKFELPLQDNPDALSLLCSKIEKVILTSGIQKNKIVGIGIGMPGFVDIKKGINYSYLPVKGKSINEFIFDQVKIPTFIDNDSSVIALAELKFGSAKGKKNAMVINAGWGIGLGMILQGQLFKGHNGFAGEFSHLFLFNNGKLCFCGKAGCLETEASLLVVVEKARKGIKAGRLSKVKLSDNENAEEASDAIIRSANQGDQFAIELLSEAGYNIGRGVAILIHLLNPEVIILSGRGSSAGKIWLAPIQHAMNEHCIPRLSANTVIEISTLGYKAELIGAAALVMENFEKNNFKNTISTKKMPVLA